MVLHVAGAADVLRVRGAALEFREDRRAGLAEEVGQHVEAAAVRHADDHLLEAEVAAALEDLLPRRNHRLAAVVAAAIGAGGFVVAEMVETLACGQELQACALAVYREAALVG